MATNKNKIILAVKVEWPVRLEVDERIIRVDGISLIWFNDINLMRRIDINDKANLSS